MKQERDKPLLYWMLIRAFMPSVLLLLFFLIFFLVVLNFASRHNQELRLGNQQAKLELAMQNLDGFLQRIYLKELEIVNSSTCKQYIYMYDDLTWYDRYSMRRSCTRRPMSFVKVIIISRMHICIFPNWTKRFLTSGSISLRRSG